MIEGAHIAKIVAKRYKSPYPCAHEDDIYSEALLWLWYYRGQRDIFTKVHRKVVSYLRKAFGRVGRYNDFREHHECYEDSTVESCQEEHTDHRIRLSRLTEKQEEIFVRYMHGEYLREIGDDIGVSEAAISYQLKAAKQRYIA